MNMSFSGRVIDYIYGNLRKKKLHFTLIDPEKQSKEKAVKIAKQAYEAGTSAIMVGGSIGLTQEEVDQTVAMIKKAVEIPVILFPGDVSGVSKSADAIFFMSLLNSRNTYYITGAQAIGAIAIKRLGIEAIPMGYIVVEPGGAVGYIGDARVIPRSKPKIAASYALAAEYLGMKLVYLEAGSGADEHVPEEMIRATKSLLSIPLIVGGGIRNGKDAEKVAKAGADIIVTGTAVEKAARENKVREKISEIVEAIR